MSFSVGRNNTARAVDCLVMPKIESCPLRLVLVLCRTERIEFVRPAVNYSISVSATSASGNRLPGQAVALMSR